MNWFGQSDAETSVAKALARSLQQEPERWARVSDSWRRDDGVRIERIPGRRGSSLFVGAGADWQCVRKDKRALEKALDAASARVRDDCWARIEARVLAPPPERNRG